MPLYKKYTQILILHNNKVGFMREGFVTVINNFNKKKI